MTRALRHGEIAGYVRLRSPSVTDWPAECRAIANRIDGVSPAEDEIDRLHRWMMGRIA